MRASRLLAVLLAPALSYACLGPSFDLEDLSSEPLALVYRTREESEHRNELLSRAKEKPRPRREGEHHFRVEDLGDYLGLGRSNEEKRADQLGRMALLDARTGDLDLLDFAPRGARPLAWSPDRRYLLYLALLGGKHLHVFAWDRDSGEVRPIARGLYQYLGASYGPDGRLALARVDPREGDRARSRIFVTRPGGGTPRLLTPGPADTSPVWSPDGGVLVYAGLDEAGGGVILAIDPLEGGEPRRIARGIEPAFFPEGDWVVYCAKRRGRWAIWRVRPDGSGKHPIGSSAHDERNPTVSPDGRFIVYVSHVGERQRLMVRALDGSGDRPLLRDGDGLIPVW
jgi:dipeptidyl aminopeptidase/acylaminoacyl peptidase